MNTLRLAVAVIGAGLLLTACGLGPSNAPIEGSSRAPLEIEVAVDEGAPTATLPLRGEVVDVVIDWDEGATDCPVAVRTAQDVRCTYAVDDDGAPATKTITVTARPEEGPALDQFGSGDEPSPDAGALREVKSFGDVGLTSLSGAFHGATNLERVPATLPGTVRDLSYAFKGATGFNQNLSTWDVSQVDVMTGTFQGARSFNNGAPSGTDAPLGWTFGDDAQQALQKIVLQQNGGRTSPSNVTLQQTGGGARVAYPRAEVDWLKPLAFAHEIDTSATLSLPDVYAAEYPRLRRPYDRGQQLIDAARALGLADEIGSLEVGKKADVVLVDLRKPHLTPATMPLHALTHFANAADVDTVVTNGRVVVRGRKTRTLDPQAVIGEAMDAAERAITDAGLTHLRAEPAALWRQSRNTLAGRA